MKTSAVGIGAAIALMVAAAAVFGIAPAEGTGRIGEFMEWQGAESLERAHDAGEFMEVHPSETVPTDWTVTNPVETGAIPGSVSEEEWMMDYGKD